MSTAPLVPYSFAVLRVVPHVHVGAFINVGVTLHARTAEFLALRAISDEATLRALAPDLDIDLLARYVRSMEAVCRGDAAAGPIALLPTSERFHWLSAPRSDVLQSSPVHSGLCADPAAELEELFKELVLAVQRPEA
jgi:hypothetical protein